MAINRELWRQPITINHIPAWLCPNCKNGYLSMVPDSFTRQETHVSKVNRSHPEWEPDWLEFKFAALLSCDNCEDVIAVAGRGEVQFDFNTKGNQIYEELFIPEFISPSPPLFNVPDKCPPDVTHEIEQAFISSWNDYSAAGNHIRTAVERLLDYKKIPKSKIVRHRRKSLSLHQRIKNFSNVSIQNKEIGDHLLAIKWLGNVGSHSSDLTRDDIFDALDILDYVLDEIINKNRHKIRNLSKYINRRKGRPKRHK